MAKISEALERVVSTVNVSLGVLVKAWPRRIWGLLMA